MADYLDMEVQLTLKLGELLDLIEMGAVAQMATNWEPTILAEIRELFSELVGELDALPSQV